MFSYVSDPYLPFWSTSLSKRALQFYGYSRTCSVQYSTVGTCREERPRIIKLRIHQSTKYLFMFIGVLLTLFLLHKNVSVQSINTCLKSLLMGRGLRANCGLRTISPWLAELPFRPLKQCSGEVFLLVSNYICKTVCLSSQAHNNLYLDDWRIKINTVR